MGWAGFWNRWLRGWGSWNWCLPAPGRGWFLTWLTTGSGSPTAGVGPLVSGAGFQGSWLRDPRLLGTGVSLLVGGGWDQAPESPGTGADWLVVGACLDANKLEGRFQNCACQYQEPLGRMFLVEHPPKNCCCKNLCPQGESQFPPAAPGGSLSSASGYDSGFFQSTDPTLGLR